MTGRNVSRGTLAWRWVTDRGLRIVGGPQTLSLYQALRDASLPEVAELVPGDGSLLLVLKPGAAVPPRLRDILNSAACQSGTGAIGRQHEIAVKYDGQDLPVVAEYLRLSPSSLIEGLGDIAFRVKFLGFQPGFAYLEGLPPAWHLPRRDIPRTRVPAGSVALGGCYCGIYPAEGPGGWHLIGQTQEVLFDPAAQPPARFQPGDIVRLRPA